MRNSSTRPTPWRSLRNFKGTYKSTYASRRLQPPSRRRRYPKPASLATVVQRDGVVKLPMVVPGWKPGTRVFFRMTPFDAVRISTSPNGALFKKRLQTSRIRTAWPDRKWKLAI